MTIGGAITELQLLLKANDMPTYYKPCIKKVLETIQMELVCQMHRLDEIEHRIEMHEKAMAKVVTPQTDCETCKHYNLHHEAIACERCLDGKHSRYEPQTESTGSPIGDYRDGVGAWQTDEFKNTDCPWK